MAVSDVSVSIGIISMARIESSSTQWFGISGKWDSAFIGTVDAFPSTESIAIVYRSPKGTFSAIDGTVFRVDTVRGDATMQTKVAEFGSTFVITSVEEHPKVQDDWVVSLD